uniref:Protein tyrosine phosphatase receptor type Q n=1 Tax=Sinocyclocheilus rhinocerous TaxID=307959 RepID=A0A673G0M3_9TELE
MLSWRMPVPLNPTIHSFAIRYKEMCPYPDPTFTEVIKSLDIPETLLNTLSPGATYNIKVAAVNKAGIGPFSQSLYYKTAEAPPGLVSNLTAFAEDHTSVLVTWFLPVRINGLITKFAVKVKHARTGQTVRMLELNAEDIMNGALPHCNSSQLTSAVLPTVTLSAVPPASIWIVPISVKIDELHPYTPYVFEVSAFTSDGEGQIASTMVRMPEAAPEDPPQNVVFRNITSKSLSLTWDPPKIITGRFSYVIQLHSSEEFISENGTIEQVFMYTGLTPYTQYYIRVMAKSAGATGPAAVINITTLAEAPSAVSHLTAEAVDSTSVRLSWRPPSQPNGLITHYRILVLYRSTLVQDITLREQVKHTKLHKHTHTQSQYFIWFSFTDYMSLCYRTLHFVDGESFPPSDLTYEDIGSSEVNVSWSPPLLANGIILFYNVEYWNATHSLNQTTHVPYVTLSNLRKYARYRISVQAATQVGMGNHTSEILNITTLEDVPSSPPKFLIARKLNDTEVELSWKPPAEANSEILYYIVRVWNLSSEFVANLTETSVVLSVDGLGQYNASVSSWTRLGDGGMLIYITFSTIESVPSGPVHNLTATIYSSTAVVISWDPPLEPNGRVFYQLSLQEAGTTHPSINRTVNITITKTTTDNIYLFTKLRKYFPYIIKVTPATGAGSAVNHTAMLLLRTDEDVPSSPPLPGASRNLSSTSIHASWFPPVEANGEILDYALVLQGPGTVNKTYTTETHLMLSELTPFTPYNLSIAAVTRIGVGPSVIIPLHTDEAVPMSPPRDLIIFNHTLNSVWLQWEPSPEPNGIVQHYGFRILELNTYTFRYQNSSDASTQSELSGFRPHNSHEISVCAFTRAGNGDQYSLPVIFTTNESVSDAVGNLTCSGLDWNSVYMEWELPIHSNGEILYYLVRSGNLEEEAHPLMLTHKVAHTFIGLLPDVFYVISVAAVNSAGIGEETNCTAHTPPESVPGPPQLLTIMDVTSDRVSLSWERPVHVPGLLQGYNVEIQQLARNCEQKQHMESCVESGLVEWVEGETSGVTLSPLLKYREYRIRLVAFTRAGAGEPSVWIHTQTLAGNPDAPPSAISVFPSPTGLKIVWDEPSVISGPTSYIIDITALDGSGYNISLVRYSEEIRVVVVGNLTAFTLYSITITAFTGQLSNARTDGKASEPVLARTLEDEPKDPPKNVTLTVIPEEVTRVYVTFSPPDEPNGNISAYHVAIYRNGQLDFYINSLPVISNPNNTMTAIIDGLKGGFNYSIRIAAVNGAGLGPSSEVQVTTGVKAPPKPSRRPRAALNNAGVIISTSNTITIEMPECFFTDDHGPIQKVQVIVSEPAVMDYGNLSNWKSVFLYPTAPYLTDEGFLNPKCLEKAERMSTNTKTYVIGADEGCLSEDAETLCNGPLKPKTYYVFKFRATNIRGQYTDSEYSDRVRTAGMDASNFRTFSIGFFLIYFQIHRRQKEGGTYSPREAEVIETKFKLDQLIAVADLELKEEKINRNHSNMLIYNNSRVKLLSEPGMPGSDYINASFVSGYLCPNEFIATQGPLPSTVADFWRMIWETGTKTIVMLTQCFEKGRVRCHQYWPEDNKPVTVFADIIITKLTEDVHPDWTVRALRVERHGSYMIVHHFNYTSWPEHGVPESSSTLIQFVKAVRSHRGHDNTTNMVHCSAGVGRTGVFIALDHLIQHVRDHDFVDIYGLVAELRSERMCMVQNLAQYMFLHQSTLDLLSAKGNSQSIWFVNYSALEKMDSLDAMEGDVELEWEETTM